MKKIFLILVSLVSFLGKAQVTLIPDSDFEKALIYKGIDTDGILNGQLLTADAQCVVNLDLNAVPLGHGGYVMNLAGIGDFINLEQFRAYYNNFGTVNLSTLTKLKTLFFISNNVTTIDLSASADLEQLVVGNGAMDFGPFNKIKTLNLSNNNKIKHIEAYNMVDLEFINLRNNIADSVYILLGNQNNTPYNVCIEVDNPVAATSSVAPYDKWTLDYQHFPTNNGIVYFSANCALSVEKFVNENFKIYPNPTTDYVVIEQKQTNSATLQSVQIIDSSGKWIRSVNDNFHHINTSGLSKGMYLFVIQTDKGNKTEKVIVE
jgi:hypothetical protein